MGFQLEQVQGFTPTPMTVATVIYYSGYHPYTLKKTYTPRSKQEREDQHRFFFWYKKDNQGWIRKSLSKVNRMDLIERLIPVKTKDKKSEFKSVLPKNKRHKQLSLPSEFPNNKRRNKNSRKKKRRR
jgi:hypothetical protein